MQSGQNLNAGLLSATFQYAFTKQFSAGPGIDYTTGGVIRKQDQ